MKLMKTLIFTILICLIAGNFISCKKNRSAVYVLNSEKMALGVSDGWIKLLDDEKYSECRDQAAELLKNSVTQDQWIRLMQTVRKPFGSVIHRQVNSRDYKTSLPGVPDAEYVIIRYETSFVNKKESVETVTVMKNIDETWKVAGYFIK